MSIFFTQQLKIRYNLKNAWIPRLPLRLLQRNLMEMFYLEALMIHILVDPNLNKYIFFFNIRYKLIT